MSTLHRAWFNVPSSNDPLHFLHGERVLMSEDVYAKGRFGDSHVVYFLRGGTISMVAPKSTLSPGWYSGGWDGQKLVTRKIESLKDET